MRNISKEVEGLADMRPWLIRQMEARARLHRANGIIYNRDDAAIDEMAAAELRKVLAMEQSK